MVWPIAIIIIAVIFGILFLPESPRYLISSNQIEKAIILINKWIDDNNGDLQCKLSEKEVDDFKLETKHHNN